MNEITESYKLPVYQMMNEHGQTFNPNVLIGHYELNSWFSDFALYLNTQWSYFFDITSKYHQTFDPKFMVQ